MAAAQFGVERMNEKPDPFAIAIDMATVALITLLYGASLYGAYAVGVMSGGWS